MQNLSELTRKLIEAQVEWQLREIQRRQQQAGE
jgi:hypothetical protein